MREVDPLNEAVVSVTGMIRFVDVPTVKRGMVKSSSLVPVVLSLLALASDGSPASASVALEPIRMMPFAT